MADLTTVTNANFDTLADAVPGPFGPLTRVAGATGSLQNATRFLPNSRTKIEVYSDVLGVNGPHFFISYEELSDTAVTERIMREAFGVYYNAYDLQVFLEVAYNSIVGIAPEDLTEADYERTMRLFQYFPKLRDLPPVWEKSELKNSNRNVASFTLSGTGATRTLTNTSTGYHIDTYVIDWGDGDIETYSATEDEPFVDADHVYDADGTYNVQLYVGGRGGFDISPVDAELVNVP